MPNYLNIQTVRLPKPTNTKLLPKYSNCQNIKVNKYQKSATEIFKLSDYQSQQNTDKFTNASKTSVKYTGAELNLKKVILAFKAESTSKIKCTIDALSSSSRVTTHKSVPVVPPGRDVLCTTGRRIPVLSTTNGTNNGLNVIQI